MASTTHQFPAAQTAVATTDGPLSSFEMHGYRPSSDLSDDVNYMDVVMIITRSSMLRQGSMGCILVKPSHPAPASYLKDTNNSQNTDGHPTGCMLGRIIAAATNTSLFHPGDSDIHAEINAIGQVAGCTLYLPEAHPQLKKNYISTQGVTAYISMPPCKRCFGALYASGVKRIVSRIPHPGALLKAASKVGIEMVSLTKQEMVDQKIRLDDLFANENNVGSNQSEHKKDVDKGEKTEEILIWRRQRKEEKRARKMAKIAKDARSS